MDIGSVLGRLAAFAGDVYGVIVILAYLIGLWYVGSGIAGMVNLSNTGTQGRQGETTHPLMTMVMGAALMGLDSFGSAAWSSLSGEQAAGGWRVLKYSMSGATQQANAMISNVLTIVALFGWASVLRGIVAFKDATDGKHGGGFEDPAWKGFVHVFAGAACINIDRTIDAVKGTFF